MARRLDNPAIIALGITPADIARWDAGASNGTGGSFLSSQIARVDPSGSDSTGTVGDLAKPFLTVQGAIDAIESGSYTFPIIDVGNNHFSGIVTTSIPRIRFMGTADEINSGMIYFSLVCSELIVTNPAVVVELHQCEVNRITATGNIKLGMEDGGVAGLDWGIKAGGTIDVVGNGTVHAAVTDIIQSTTNSAITLKAVYVSSIDSGTSDVTALSGTLIRNVDAANNVSLIDSRIFNSNSASGTTSYADVLLNTDNIVFHDYDPHVAGAAYWVNGVLTKSAG